MKKYFIGGLGSNIYHSKDFLQELDSQVYFLSPYEKHLRDETELKLWFKNEIVEGDSICLIGHSLGGDLARYLASEFHEVKKLILLDGGYLDLDKILTLKSFEQIEKDLDDYDYILTTFSVENDFVKEIKHTKIIELNPILTEKDIKKLENAGLKKNKKIKMTALLKVILENSSDVNVKKLINSLDEAFPEKIYNDIDKNKFSLGDFLKQENIFKVNLNSFEEILNKFLNLSFLQKSDINDIINRASNNNFYSYLEEKIEIIFHKLNTKNSQDNVLIAINEKEIDINGKKLSTIILINSNCEIKYKAIIYNFVKLFFLNSEFSFNNSRLNIYDYLISNI